MSGPTNTPRVLSAGDYVTMHGWVRAYPISTVRAQAEMYGNDGAEAYARAVKRGFETAFTVNAGSVIVSDPVEGLARGIEIKRNLQLATVLFPGEIVAIEGQLYRVEPRGQQYQDPIWFVRRPA